jgi:AcrR family transcriptional regulator
MAAEKATAHRSGHDRRQALLRAAFDCIAERGFEGLRLRQVAGDAGIDHSTLHHYFSTKEELIAGVVGYATRQFWPTMPAEGSPAERLHTHLENLAGMTAERPSLFVVLRELELRASHDPVVRSVMDQLDEGWRTALTAVLKPGVADGTWAGALDLGAGVELIMATVRGVNLTPSRADDVLRQLERLLTGTATTEPARAAASEGG